MPECVHEAREFCEQYVKQLRMKRYEKQKLVRWVWLEGRWDGVHENYVTYLEVGGGVMLDVSMVAF